MDSDKRLQILSRRFGPRVAAAILGIDVEDVVEFRNDPQPLHQMDTGARLLQRNADLAITADSGALTWERDSVGSYSGLEAPSWRVDLLEGEQYFQVPDGSYMATLAVEVGTPPSSGAVRLFIPFSFGTLAITPDSPTGVRIVATAPAFPQYDNPLAVGVGVTGAEDCVLSATTLLLWKFA